MENGNNDEKLKVFPNPIKGQAEILFYAKQTGNATISIFDIAGKKVLQNESNLMQGYQNYQLTGLKQGFYLINISGNSYFYTSNLISQNLISSEAKINYISSEDKEITFNSLKSTKATISMAYFTNDLIRFTGYAGGQKVIKYDVPISSKTITFDFPISICPSTVTDIDSNIYNIVQIGNQCWFGKNLNVTHYQNGDSISVNSYWSYLNDTNFASIYGRLYGSNTLIDYRGLCPNGWHVPLDTEWIVLTDYLNGAYVAGGKLKETGLAHWQTPNAGASDEAGFTALPGGMRDFLGVFNDIEFRGNWWTITFDQYNPGYLIGKQIRNTSTQLSQISITYSGLSGLSVRCIKN